MFEKRISLLAIQTKLYRTIFTVLYLVLDFSRDLETLYLQCNKIELLDGITTEEKSNSPSSNNSIYYTFTS